jgi:hypothetical protein
MSYFAVIEDNKIVNVIVADSKEIAEQVTSLQCVNVDGIDAGIGWSYDGTTFTSPYKPNLPPI